MTRRASVRALVLAALLVPVAAFGQGEKPAPAIPPPSKDSADATRAAHATCVVMQQRDAEVMGVDQERSVRVFDVLPNGGVMELQRASDDSAGIRAIRVHLRAIAQAFASGDVDAPSRVRMTSVPGALVMADRRNLIRYDYRDLPRGGALRLTTSDCIATQAIWDFLAYQRNEHMAAEPWRARP
jgi:hypothetical protein